LYYDKQLKINWCVELGCGERVTWRRRRRRKESKKIDGETEKCSEW